MTVPLSVLRVKREMETVQIGVNDELDVAYEEDGTCTLLYSMYLDEGVYKGHRYPFQIRVPDTYPFSPPKATCIVSVLHPSIDSLGRVCMNVTREDWSLDQGIQSVIFCLSSIFYDVPTEEPLNRDAHALFMEDPEAFKKEAERVYKSGHTTSAERPQKE